jgi:hypothetical protein
MDFSHAGYMGGGVALPTLPVKKEVAPSGGDDSATIQAAIDEVSALPLVNGFRGAVLLRPGTFHCSKEITLTQDGVVLRGSGSGKEGTLIEMNGEPHTAFVIEGKELSFPKETPANTFPITDAYVPAGTLTLSVQMRRGWPRAMRFASAGRGRRSGLSSWAWPTSCGSGKVNPTARRRG